MTAIEMTPHLVYFADPMCSWCWGFSPVMAAVERRFDTLPIRVVMGGLRPFTTEKMDQAAKARSRGHWERVEAASGQKFDHAFFQREGFVYDTEPSCRAVVVMRRQGDAQALAGLRAIQSAFYAHDTDVTDPAELTRIAATLGHDQEAFRAAFDSEEARQETARDFAVSQNAGVQGFPTLIAGPGADGRYALVTNGFQTEAAVMATLEQWQGVPA